jgi:hypothetical protein
MPIIRKPILSISLQTAFVAFALLSASSFVDVNDAQLGYASGLASVEARTTLLVADAREAKMTRQGVLAVKDHYGNPAHFVKYIIRRPPTLA